MGIGWELHSPVPVLESWWTELGWAFLPVMSSGLAAQVLGCTAESLKGATHLCMQSTQGLLERWWLLRSCVWLCVWKFLFSFLRPYVDICAICWAPIIIGLSLDLKPPINDMETYY